MREEDRRFYSRLMVDMECNIYAEKYPYELQGVIKDVSESGLRILMKNLPDNVLEAGDIVVFTACDEYISLGDKLETATLNAIEVEIIRVEKTESFITLGVKLLNRDKDYETYVTNSKVVNFLKKFKA